MTTPDNPTSALHPSPEGNEKQRLDYFDSLPDSSEEIIINPRAEGVQIFLKKLQNLKYPHGWEESPSTQ